MAEQQPNSPEQPPRQSTSSPNPLTSHRSSFAENLRHTRRHPSLSHAAVQELIHQPSSKSGDPKFAGKDWRQVKIGEFVQDDDVKWVELDTGVEEATKVCLIASY